jgi:prephenate dehydrogenase
LFQGVVWVITPDAASLDAAFSEVRVPVPDRPGVIADVATLASELDVNLFDFEVAHSSEGQQGVLILIVAADRAERLQGGLLARGYRPALRPLA